MVEGAEKRRQRPSQPAADSIINLRLPACLHSPHFRSLCFITAQQDRSKALPCEVACEHRIPRADAARVTLRAKQCEWAGE